MTLEDKIKKSREILAKTKGVLAVATPDQLKSIFSILPKLLRGLEKLQHQNIKIKKALKKAEWVNLFDEGDYGGNHPYAVRTCSVCGVQDSESLVHTSPTRHREDCIFNKPFMEES